MALGVPSITATVDDSGRWVTVAVTCTGMTSGSVMRVVADGSRAVRGASNKAGAGGLAVADYEAPQNTPLTYYATVTDGVSTKATGVVTAAAVVDRGGDAMFGMVNPLAVVIVHVIGLPDLATGAPREVVRVINRADPIVVSDVRSYPTGTLMLATVSDAERFAVGGLLSSGAVLAFSPHFPTYGFDDVWYLSIGDVTERRASEVATDQTREWDLAFQRVAPPAADFIGPAFTTWQDPIDASTTWQAALTAGTTWLLAQVAV
jgi:hypothetical protein